MLDRILTIYNRGGDINIRYRSRALLKVDLASTLFFLIFTIINIFEQDYLAAAVELFIMFVFISNIFFLKKGYYKSAVNMILIVCFLAAIMIIFSEAPGEPYEGFKIFTFTMPTLVGLTLFAYKKRHAYVFLISGELLMLYSLIFRALPVQALPVPQLISLYVTPMMLFTICNFFVVQVINNSTVIFGSLSQQEEMSSQRFMELNKLVEDFKGNLNLGNTLHSLAQNTSINSESITERLGNMDSVLEDLTARMSSTSDSQNKIMNAGETVKEGMESQTTTLRKSTASVEEMAASIRHLSDTMQSAVQSLNELREESAQSENRIKEAGKMMDTMLESNKKINEITAVIEDVGSQTNLLAMNASIEAAHAGEVGKGFAVVAAEIRKLAETTNSQSKQIRDLLEISNINSMKAVDRSREVQQHFVEIMQKIEEQSQSMSGVYDSLSELTAGAAEIAEEVVSLDSVNTNVNDSVIEMSSRIAESHETVKTTAALTKEVVKLMTEISQATDSLNNDARTLAEIGKKNTENLHKMETELQMLH